MTTAAPSTTSVAQHQKTGLVGLVTLHDIYHARGVKRGLWDGIKPPKTPPQQ